MEDTVHDWVVQLQQERASKFKQAHEYLTQLEQQGRATDVTIRSDVTTREGVNIATWGDQTELVLSIPEGPPQP